MDWLGVYRKLSSPGLMDTEIRCNLKTGGQKMIEKRRKFTVELKREAVRLTQETDKSVAEIARELGINPNTLYRWRQEQGEYAEQAFPGNGRLRPEEEELRRLRRELEIVKQERDILKKAISIFSARQR